MKITKEPNYPAILHFTEKAGYKEYIVIANEGPIPDHALPDYECYSVMELEDTGSLPTDTPLSRDN